MKWILSLIGCLIVPYIYAQSTWQTVLPGLDFSVQKQASFSGSRALLAYRIDVQRYDFKLVFSNSTAFVSDMAKSVGALLAINGGYFSKEFKPLGLRMNDYQLINPKKNISWWGIFYIKQGRAHIVANRDYAAAKNSEFAIQAGPRLLIKGSIPLLKAGVAQRSGICIDKNRRVILAVTENNALTLTQWAKALRDKGCLDALNLDGGTSSQLYADLPGHRHTVSNYKSVSDAIVVLAKQR